MIWFLILKNSEITKMETLHGCFLYVPDFLVMKYFKFTILKANHNPDNFFNLNNPDFYGILIRFVINLAFLIVLIRVIYFKYTKKKKFLFTFFMLGITVFFISSMLKSAKKQKILKELSTLTGKEILKFRIRRINYKNKVA